jgi:hypothetical protein
MVIKAVIKASELTDELRREYDWIDCTSAKDEEPMLRGLPKLILGATLWSGDKKITSVDPIRFDE